MTTSRRHTLPLCGLLALACLSACGAEATSPVLPSWQVLEYEQKAFYITANSRVEIAPDTDNDTIWRLTAKNSVASNSEVIELDFAAADGHAHERSRLSKGKQERYKTFKYLPDYILRVRRDPPAKTTLPPWQWPVSSSKKIAYPPSASGMVVTDAYALLLLAERFGRSTQDSAQIVINTEFNFYRVEMTHSDGPTIKAKYKVTGAAAVSAEVSGSVQTRAVSLQVSPLGEQPDKPDFSLLGLNGKIVVLFDEVSGLPVQLRGNAPRVGATEISLKAVTLREPPA